MSNLAVDHDEGRQQETTSLRELSVAHDEVNMPVLPKPLCPHDGENEPDADPKAESLTIETTSLPQSQVLACQDQDADVKNDKVWVTAADSKDTAPTCFALVWLQTITDLSKKHRHIILRSTKWTLFLLYLAYTGYSLYRVWGTEGATRLLLLLVIVLYVTIGRRLVQPLMTSMRRLPWHKVCVSRTRVILRRSLYALAVAGAVVYLALQVAPYRPRNLMSLAGVAFLLLTGLVFSTQPNKVNWHAVFWGTMLQFYLAIVVLRTSLGYNVVYWLGERVTEYIQYTDSGSAFLFGDSYAMHRFVFKAMPVTLFINATIAVLYHYGVMQAFIANFGRFLSSCLDTSPIESVNAAAGIFIGLAEAPLFIKPFLNDVTDSEMFAIMTGNFATISGSTMGAVIAFGIPANHLLAASVMSAPAALAMAKLMCPDITRSTIRAKDAYNVNIGSSSSVLEVVSKAAVTGVTIVVTICANILVFVAFLDFADHTVEWFGDQAGVEDLSFRRMLSYCLYPLMYLCGVEPEDLLTMGRLVGVKVLTNAQLGYKQAAVVVENSATFTDYRSHSNGTWHYQGNDLVLDAWNRTLVGGVMTDRSVVMSTYMLCGFCNLSSMAVAIGTLTALAPKRTSVVLQHVIRANVAANIACFMTGCMAGLLHY